MENMSISWKISCYRGKGGHKRIGMKSSKNRCHLRFGVSEPGGNLEEMIDPRGEAGLAIPRAAAAKINDRSSVFGEDGAEELNQIGFVFIIPHLV